MKFLERLKRIFIKDTVPLAESHLRRMDKDQLETYARTLGLELDKRYSKETLIKQILDEQKYHE